MILGQPGYGVEILGEYWSYTNDRWGDTYACIDYTRDTQPYLFFEECFAFTQPDLTFESQRDAILRAGFETLEPATTFGSVGQISLLANGFDDNSSTGVKFFELIGVDNYILLVEMNMVTDDTSPLQSIYEKEAADIINYALQNMLEKSHLVPLPTATPLSPTQEGYYAELGNKLITELEASTLYEGTWEALGDYIDPDNPMACRDFEDRTNADVLWVSFSNCVMLENPNYEFDVLAEAIKKKSENVVLQSSHQYDNQFVVYGKFKGHTYFYAYLLDGDHLYFVSLESRTIGNATVENLFARGVDDFIYAVLMSNLEK
jgi:hypothetical protein